MNRPSIHRWCLNQVFKCTTSRKRDIPLRSIAKENVSDELSFGHRTAEITVSRMQANIGWAICGIRPILIDVFTHQMGEIIA